MKIILIKLPYWLNAFRFDVVTPPWNGALALTVLHGESKRRVGSDTCDMKSRVAPTIEVS